MANQSHGGGILKKARETKGLSLRTIHEATKIPMDALRAIEEGYSIRNLSSFYLKGFIKMYAKYLGVDVNTVLENYQSVKPPQSIETQPKQAKYSKPNEFFTVEKIQIIVKVLTAIVILFALIRIGGCIVHKIKSRKNIIETETESIKEKPKVRKEKPSAALSTKQEKVKATAKSLPLQPEVKKSQALQEKVSGKINLAVRAKKNIWLQVKVDGSTVFQSTLKKGTVETWSAGESIELAGKGIGELELQLNGKIIGPLGRQERSARKIIVTKDGLTTRE